MMNRERKALTYILHSARGALSSKQSLAMARIELIALMGLDEEDKHVRMGHLTWDQEREIREQTKDILEQEAGASMEKVKEEIKRTIDGKVERDDTRDVYFIRTTGYGHSINFRDLMRGLEGRRVKVTVETEE